MGLDITAYRKLTAAPDAAVDADGYPTDDGFIRLHAAALAFTDENWPGRTAGLSAGIFSFADSFDFRAGSYSGYNAWRGQLARYAGYGSAEAVWESGRREGSFIELINFADNEGYIGPAVSEKLAKDFAEHEDRIAVLGADDSYFIAQYRRWRRAFEMAADGGAVDFH